MPTSSLLSVNVTDLLYIADNINLFYKPGKILQKKNGEHRYTHDAKRTLKLIHQHIKNRILKKIEYPYFMLGGILDPQNPRSCKAHAQIHCNKKILINEDILDFYPTTSYELVKRVWKHQFNFSDTVAEVLTKITTYSGQLPQGWKTSSYIANLALLPIEAHLVELLENKGYSYSHFIDDITVSSPTFISPQEKKSIISNIYGMPFKCGYKPKRTKHEIVSNKEKMIVTSLNVNTETPTLSKQERNNIRAMVYQLEKLFSIQGNTQAYIQKWHSLYGKVNRLKSFHKKNGEQLQERMKLIKPLK
ncbi:TPA: reverse transcriptase family protein [Legionella pneumophila]